MNEIVELIYSLFDRFGYVAVFFGVMLDNAGFPVPGELVLLITGSLVAKGDFSMAPAVMVAAAGALLSDSGWYFAGRLGSKRLIRLYCRASFGSTACLARTERNRSGNRCRRENLEPGTGPNRIPWVESARKRSEEMNYFALLLGVASVLLVIRLAGGTVTHGTQMDSIHTALIIRRFLA